MPEFVYNGATRVGDLTRNKDEVEFFQLEYPCLVKPPSYLTDYTYSKKAASLEANSFVYVLDLYIGVEERDPYGYGNMTSKRVKTHGYPFRLLLTTKTTARELYAKVAQCTRRFVLEGSPFCGNRDNLPFVVMTTSIYSASYTKDVVEDNDTVLDINPDSNALVAVWKTEADTEAHFNQEEFMRVDLVYMDDEPVGDDSDDMNVVTGSDTTKTNSSTAAVASSSSSSSGATSVSKQAVSSMSPPASPRNSLTDEFGRKRKKATGLTIYKCLDKFCEREQLNEEETLYCSKCKQHVAPVKKMDLWATPDILTVQLKRFQYIPGQYFVHR